MDQLDTYVSKLKTEFDIGKTSKRSQYSLRLQTLLTKARKEGNMSEVLKLAKRIKAIPSSDFNDPGFKLLSYVRYADDWMIGIKGSLKDTENILDLVKTYLTSMGLKLSESKTKITNINKSKALFLGTEICRSKENKLFRETKKRILRRNSKKLRLTAPLNRLRNTLSTANFMKNKISYPKFV
jgi:hypothetical protein